MQGINGIMEIYNTALPKMSFLGPTVFGPVIDYASTIAASNINKNIYSVLIIITDGEIFDKSATIE